MKKNLNILFLRTSLNLYGASKILIELAYELKLKGHKIIIGSDNKDTFKTKLENEGIKHKWLPLNAEKKNIFSFIVCFYKITQIIKHEKVDIIHSHHRWSSFIAYFSSRILNVPLITTMHGSDEGKKAFTILGDRVICVSEVVKNYVIYHFRVKPSVVSVIPNGIKVNNKLKDIKSFQSLKGGKGSKITKILHVARLSPEKDQKTLLQAFKIVVQKHPKVVLQIVGKGPLENELRKLCFKLGITNNVQFAGETSNINKILMNTEIKLLVLTSLREGLPISILEAYSYKKPVIATNVGDIAKIVLNGETGFVLSPSDYLSIAEKIIYLLENSKIATEMGQKGQYLLKKKFSLDHMVDQTENVYYSIL